MPEAKRSGIDELELGRLDQPAEAAAGPDGNALHQEHLLEHGQILADCFVVEADLPAELREVA